MWTLPFHSQWRGHHCIYPFCLQCEHCLFSANDVDTICISYNPVMWTSPLHSPCCFYQYTHFFYNVNIVYPSIHCFHSLHLSISLLFLAIDRLIMAISLVCLWHQSESPYLSCQPRIHFGLIFFSFVSLGYHLTLHSHGRA